MQCSDSELSGGGLCAKRVTDANPKQNNFKVKLLLNKGCRLTALSNDVPAFTTASTQLQERCLCDLCLRRGGEVSFSLQRHATDTGVASDSQ